LSPDRLKNSQVENPNAIDNGFCRQWVDLTYRYLVEQMAFFEVVLSKQLEMKLTIERKHVHDASIGECFETLVELANSCFVFGVPFSSAKSHPILRI
jgi:hypothetical protein